MTGFKPAVVQQIGQRDNGRTMRVALNVYGKAGPLKFAVMFGRSRQGCAERNQGTAGIPKQFYYLDPFKFVTVYIPKREVRA